MLHYATPALNHLYFVDPQWLCDMLAHVVTVPEVNRFIQRNDGEGVWGVWGCGGEGVGGVVVRVWGGWGGGDEGVWW